MIPGLVLLVLLVSSAEAAPQRDALAARSRDATAAMKAGRFEAAAQIYRELLKDVPDDPGLLMNLGMALAMGGREADAIAPLERAMSLNTSLLPAQLFLGSSYLALGQAEKALPPLERAIAGTPANPEPRRMLASAYASLGRHADAAAQLRRVTELAPKEPSAWYALGHAYNAIAQDALGSFQELPDQSPWRRLLLADALHADGRLVDAFGIYREVLEVMPDMASVRESVARIYQASGRADWAAQERKHIPPAAACRGSKAACAFRMARYRSSLAAALAGSDVESRYWRVRAATALAEAAFKRLESLPDSRERRELRATRAFSERRYTDAIADLKVALSLAPADPALLDDLGSAYYFARDYEQAAAILSKLVERQPTDVRLLTLAGDSLLQLQRLEEALALLRRAVERDPADPMPQAVLGRAYVQTGDFAAAIRLLEPQLAGDTDGSVHIQLARAYRGAGQAEKAEPLMKRAEALQQAAQARTAQRGELTPPR